MKFAYSEISPVRFALSEPPRVSHYAIAIGTVALALAVASLLSARADPSHFTLFFAAVMVSAWYGGLGAGLLATVLSALSLDYFFISPIHTVTANWAALLRLGTFSTVALVTSSLTAARKRAEEDLRRAHDELEQRVRERTAELAAANTSLRSEIAERRRAEQELWRLQAEMGRVERLATLGRMAATIAHELGTPLNSVLGYSHLLAQETLSETARRRLTIIETQVRRMEEIIQHYLSQTRGNPRHGIVDINALAEDTLLILNPILQQNGVTVVRDFAKELPCLPGDGASLQRVLTNIIDNSVTALQGGGVLRVKTRVAEPSEFSGPGVSLEIADNGVGIAPELLPKIFDLFVTTKPPGKGTGLGLALCQEIIKAHQGIIRIQSEIGKGTCITINLPAGPLPKSNPTAQLE